MFLRQARVGGEPGTAWRSPAAAVRGGRDLCTRRGGKGLQNS